MSVEQLKPLLDKDTFVPGSVTVIAARCDDWFRNEPSLVSFTIRSIFHDLIARGWDEEQGIETPIFERFVGEILPRLDAVLSDGSTDTLHALVVAYRDFVLI